MQTTDLILVGASIFVVVSYLAFAFMGIMGERTSDTPAPPLPPRKRKNDDGDFDLRSELNDLQAYIRENAPDFYAKRKRDIELGDDGELVYDDDSGEKRKNDDGINDTSYGSVIR